MSETNAAATLSLKIDTGSAAAELKTLKTEYISLREAIAEQGKAMPSIVAAGESERVKVLTSNLASAQRAIATLNKEVETLQAKMQGSNSGFNGAGKLMASYTTTIEQGRVTAKKAIENITSDQVIEMAKQEQNAKAHAEAMAKLSSPSMVRTFDEASIANARRDVNARASVYSDQYAAEQKAADNLIQLQARTRAQLKVEQELMEADAKSHATQMAALAARNAAVSSPAMNRAFDEASIANARANVNARAASYSTQYAAEQQAAENLVQLQARTRAQLKIEQELMEADAREHSAKMAAASKQSALISSPAMNKVFDEASIANARRNVNSRASTYSDDYVAEQQAAENLIQLQARTRAQLKIEQDLIEADARAHAEKMAAIAKKQAADTRAAAIASDRYVSGDDKTKARMTVAASRMLDSGRDVSRMAPEALAAAQSTVALNSAQKLLGNSIQETAKHQIQWNKAADEAHALARGLSGSLGTLWITYGSLIPLMAGAALGSGFVQAAKQGSEFAYQLTFVKSLSSESAAAVEDLSKSALDLGKSSLQGPGEIASGFRILAQAGLSAAEALKVMPDALHLATVGEMNMEQAATTLVGVMNAFNLTVEESGHVGDIFAKAAAMSQTSVQAMTESMKTASVVGEQYGASIEDTATALTLLAKVNITGTAAGTAMRNMLKELYTPVPQAAAAIEKLGLKTKDAEGNLRAFPEVIYDLKEKLKDFDKAGQTQILQRLFGERGAKEAIVMLSKTRDEWEALKASIKNSDGFMDGVSNELEGTVKGKWAQAMNTLQAQLISTFQEMSPLFAKLADQFKGLFESEKFTSNLEAIVSGMANMTSAFITLTPLLVDGAKAWLTYKAAVITSTVLIEAATAFSVLAASAQAASGVMGPALTTMASTKGMLAGIPALLGALPPPLALIGAAVAAGTTAWVLWGDRASEAAEKAQRRIDGLKTAIENVNVLFDSLAFSGKGDADTFLVASNRALAQQSKAYTDLNDYLSKAKLARLNNQADLNKQFKFDYSTSEITDQTGAKYTASAFKDSGTLQALIDKYGEANVAAKRAKEQADKMFAEGDKTAEQKSRELQRTGPKRNVDEILSKDGKNTQKDERTIFNKDLQSSIAQEKVKLDMEMLRVDKLVAEQAINSIQAIELRNKARMTELGIEREILLAKNKEASDKKDKVLIEDTENKLKENALAISKQTMQGTVDLAQAYTSQRNTISDLSLSTQRYVEDLSDERKMLSMTSAEAEKYRIEKERSRAVEDANIKLSRGGTPEVANAEISLANDKAAAKQADYDYRNSFEGGWNTAFKNYVDNATNSAKLASDAFQSATSLMEDAIVSFTTTGKLSYQDFAKSVLKSLAQIAAKQAAMGLIKMATSLVGSFSGSASSSSSSASTTPGYSAGDLGSGIRMNALGNVYQSPSLHNYVNQVHDTPKFFAFAKGGVLGEAGPEAIMPLRRGPDGRLGVTMSGGGASSGGDVSVNIEINIGAGGNVSQETTASSDGGMSADGAKRLGEMMANVARTVLVSEMRSGGMLERVKKA